MSMENLQALNYAMTKPINKPVVEQSVNPFGAGGVGAIEKTQPVDVYSACEALSMKDGRSPDVSGTSCGCKLDLCKNGCIDNLAWGI